LRGEVEGACVERDRREVERRAGAGGVEHVEEVAGEAEAGDVGHGVGPGEEAGRGALRAGHLGEAGGDVGAVRAARRISAARIVPEPRGFVRISASPGRAPASVTAGPSARPVTVKPSVSSAPVVVWPPTISAPSAAKISLPRQGVPRGSSPEAPATAGGRMIWASAACGAAPMAQMSPSAWIGGDAAHEPGVEREGAEVVGGEDLRRAAHLQDRGVVAGAGEDVLRARAEAGSVGEGAGEGLRGRPWSRSRRRAARSPSRCSSRTPRATSAGSFGGAIGGAPRGGP
jgi:hypothetical protein